MTGKRTTSAQQRDTSPCRQAILRVWPELYFGFRLSQYKSPPRARINQKMLRASSMCQQTMLACLNGRCNTPKLEKSLGRLRNALPGGRNRSGCPHAQATAEDGQKIHPRPSRYRVRAGILSGAWINRLLAPRLEM